ncbi:MAG: CPBP family intramembrane metalloprotease [Bacteroidia bacterium]|nr:CPBP family intramembrane metalloprotease [Bacteroidia bacterium]
MELLEDTSLTPGFKDILFFQYAMISQHLSIFILPGILLLARLKNPGQVGYPETSGPTITDIRLTVILTLFLFPVLGITSAYNSELSFPEWLSGLEKWILDQEESANNIFEIVFSDKRAGLIIVNFIIIAILPAVGEELIFRGILQRIFIRMFSSGYAGVVFTASLFSILHFQFLGFVPRFILGLVCGLLFLWSGKLWLSVIVHFINNAVGLVLMYLKESVNSADQTDYNFWTQLVILIILLIPVTVILNDFRKRSVIEEKQELQISDPQAEDRLP